MENTDQNKIYKSHLTTLSILFFLIFLFTDNFLWRYIKKSVEYMAVQYDLRPKNINIKTNLNYNKEKIKALVPHDISIFKLDLENLYDKIIRIPEVQSVVIKRNLFSSIQIDLQLYHPIASIDNSLLICSDGSIVKNNFYDQKLPSINGISAKKHFIEFYNKIKSFDLDILNNIKSIQFNTKHIEIKFSNNKVIKMNYKFSKKELINKIAC